MTKSQIDKLGKKIRKYIKNKEDIPNDSFEKLQEYRKSFQSDLSNVFNTISDISKKVRNDSITAFRIKRIESIISKIRRQPTMALSKMGDIAGCRILVYDENIIQKLITELESVFTVVNVNDYTKQCKDDGYRGYHMYIESPIDPSRQLEIQIRSVHWHRWASMVEIIDILYNLKIKEGQDHVDFKRFLFLLSRFEYLTFEEKKELIEIDKKHEVNIKLNEVFIKNNRKIRNDLSSTSRYNYFIFEVDEKSNSNILNFNSYEEAESEYFKKFKSNKNSNFVLTHIEKPKFQRVCTAYASYVLVKHRYLDDWYKIIREIMDKLIEDRTIEEAIGLEKYIVKVLTSQKEITKTELKDLETSLSNDSNKEHFNEWFEEVKERIEDVNGKMKEQEINIIARWFKMLIKPFIFSKK